ncbi:MAG: TonB-dependent receptor [Bacteroidales bacterium]
MNAIEYIGKFIVIFIIIGLISIQSKAQSPTLYGYVRDKSSGESLIGAVVAVDGTQNGVTTNSYGFFSLTLSAGTYKIKCSYMGYKTESQEINLTGEKELNIELEASSFTVDEISIVAKQDDKIGSTEMNSQSLKMSDVRIMPATMGETDIIKTFQLFPGVQATNEGLTNLSVRGGSFDQNLFLLDGAPVYNPSHALGFFSVFNTDAIKSAKIYKGAFPAQFGGRLSSVVDVHMKEGSNKKFGVSGGIGLIASRLTLESPFAKGKGSFIISGRGSYAGTTANLLGSVGQNMGVEALNDFNNKNEISFYDINAKVNYQLGSKDRIYLSAYTGNDHFYYYSIDDDSSMDWGNITGTARWNHIFNSKLFANTMLVYSKYNYSYILKDDARHFKWSSDLGEIDLKSDFDWYLNPNNHIKFGFSVEKHDYSPGKIEPRDETSITKPFTLDQQQAIISSIYASNDQKIGEKLSVNYGIRYSAFFLLGESTVYSYSPSWEITDSTHYDSGKLVKFYQGFEPRLSFNYRLGEESSVKLSYSHNIQFQHLISNSSVGFPSDVWVPASSYIKPQTADQVSVGYYRTLNNGVYEFSAEAYYRKMNNLIDYRDNADLFLNPHIETQVLTGDGESYGLELYAEKKMGRLQGWASYTLSKTTRQIDGINDNEVYPATFDKRHSLSLVANYKLSETLTLSSVFKLSSGGWITVPEGSFNFAGSSFNYYTSRNGYKIPMYHRLDVSLTYRPRDYNTRRFKGEWSFGIYNVYNKKNIFSLFVRQQNNDLARSQAYKMYLYGITPSITYNFKF